MTSMCVTAVKIPAMDHPYMLSPPMSARDWSDKDFSGHCEGDGIPWDHVLASGVDRPSDHARVCASGP